MNYTISPNKCVVIFRNKRQRVADLQEFKLDAFWNPIRPLETAPTSNMHNFHIRSPSEVHEYLMESLRRGLSNRSSPTSKFVQITSKSSKEDVASLVWAVGLVIRIETLGTYYSHEQYHCPSLFLLYIVAATLRVC